MTYHMTSFNRHVEAEERVPTALAVAAKDAKFCELGAVPAAGAEVQTIQTKNAEFKRKTVDFRGGNAISPSGEHPVRENNNRSGFVPSRYSSG